METSSQGTWEFELELVSIRRLLGLINSHCHLYKLNGGLFVCCCLKEMIPPGYPMANQQPSCDGCLIVWTMFCEETLSVMIYVEIICHLPPGIKTRYTPFTIAVAYFCRTWIYSAISTQVICEWFQEEDITVAPPTKLLRSQSHWPYALLCDC